MTRKLWASCGACASLALGEVALLSSFARQAVPGLQSMAMLFLLLLANLLPYALLVGATFGALEAIRVRSIRSWRRPAPALAALTGLAALPYGLWLSLYTFSGAHASQIRGRTALVGLETLLVAGSFALAAGFWCWRRAGRGRPTLAIAVPAGLACAFLWASSNFHDDRYEPLHAFLGIWSLVGAWLAVHEALPAREVVPRRSKVPALASAVLLIAAVAAQLGYTREDLAWIVWSETPVSSYMTHRLRWPASHSTERDVVDSLPPVKPEVDDERTLAWRAERRAGPAPNIVLFFIDNVQADHTGAYGYDRNPTTPNFDALARRGVLFERAYASYPQTRSFTSALLLGRFVPAMSAHAPPPSFAARAVTRVLAEERDYHIFVQGWFEASRTNTFDPEFYRIDSFSRAPGEDDLRRQGPWPIAPMEAEFEKVLVHLAEAAALRKPAFVWVHLIHPHWTPDGTMAGSDAFPFGDSLVDRYDSAIADCDAWIPRLAEAIRRALPERETVWILGSDHGAGLGRYDKMAGKTIYDVHAKVPFLIVAPGVEPARIGVPVDVALDAAATLVDLAGIAPAAEYDGISLVPMMRGLPPVERPILLNHRDDRYRGVVFREWKLIRTLDATILFDLVADPQERRNLAGHYPEVVELLGRAIDVDLTERIRAYNNP